jgi:ferric-dicitrate binding protein FerR (iron transport regulator)
MSKNERDTRSKVMKPPMGEKEIRDLIRDAGRRPEIPAETLAGVREAARSAWQEMVADRTRRRFGWRAGLAALAASVLVAVLAGWWWFGGEATVVVEDIATVELLDGRVETVRRDGQEPGVPHEIGVGTVLSSGLTLITPGGPGEPSGRIALRLVRGQSVRLDEGTRVHLLSDSRLELEQGAVYVDTGASGSGGAGLEIHTPLGIVREVGTQYEVRLREDDDAVRVRVREGTVSVTRDGESHAASYGEELTLRDDGLVVRSAVAPDGPAWHWVLAAAPSPDIEGQPLASFLDWVARETGWRVRYADEAIERSVATIKLHGTIEGLRPDESLDVILQGSGLDHRVEDGTILVVQP